MDATASTTRMHRQHQHRLLPLLAAVVLGAAAAAPALATTAPKVTGGFSYNAADDPGAPRAMTVSADGTDLSKGTFTWTRPSGTYGGRITCLRVVGNDAWFAGPVTSSPPRTSEGFPAVFVYLHDGATPGSAGDDAFVWGADPGQTLSDMEALCSSMDTYLFGLWPFAVTGGDLKIR